MARDPLAAVVDAPLFIVPRVLDALQAYRLQHAKGRAGDASPQAARLDEIVDDLIGRLLAGVQAHPTKFWVLRQFQASLDLIGEADPPGRACLEKDMESLLDILGIRSSDGVLGCQRR